MNDYQAALVAAGKRFNLEIFSDDYVSIQVGDSERIFSEAEAVVVGQMLLKGAAELARRREAGK